MMEKSLRLKRRNLQDFLGRDAACSTGSKEAKRIVRQCSEIIRRLQKASKNDTATDTDSVAVVSDMTSEFCRKCRTLGETVRQDQKDEMPENMPVENTMAMASPQTPMFEIHRAEPAKTFIREPSDSYVQPTAEQDVPELSECYSEPEPVETYAEVQQVQEPVSENVPESVPQPETKTCFTVSQKSEVFQTGD